MTTADTPAPSVEQIAGLLRERYALKRVTHADSVCSACGVLSALVEHEFGGVLRSSGWCPVCSANFQHADKTTPSEATDG